MDQTCQRRERLRGVCHLQQAYRRRPGQTLKPGPAIAVHKDCQRELLPAMGTLINQFMSSRRHIFKEARATLHPEDAIQVGFDLLGLRFLGFYFGLMKVEADGWLTYGWIPEGQSQGE